MYDTQLQLNRLRYDWTFSALVRGCSVTASQTERLSELLSHRTANRQRPKYVRQRIKLTGLYPSAYRHPLNISYRNFVKLRHATVTSMLTVHYDNTRCLLPVKILVENASRSNLPRSTKSLCSFWVSMSYAAVSLTSSI